MPWYTHPIAVKGAATLAGGVYRAFNPDQREQIMMDVLEEMKFNRKRLLRQSRGDFTGQEREQIASAAEPGLNRVAANVSQRGLGTSGAGLQVMADASVAPYADARVAAGEQLIMQDAAMMDAVTAFPPDNSFFDDIGASVQAFYEYKGLRGLDRDAPDEEDDIARGFLQTLLGLAQKYKAYMQSGGGQPLGPGY